MHTQPVLLDDDRASAGASNEDIKSAYVPDGVVWTLDHVAIEDETTACTSARVGIERRGKFSPLAEQLSPVAGVLYHTGQPFRLEAGDRLMARFVGSTSGDKLRLVANGVATQPGG